MVVCEHLKIGGGVFINKTNDRYWIRNSNVSLFDDKQLTNGYAIVNRKYRIRLIGWHQQLPGGFNTIIRFDSCCIDNQIVILGEIKFQYGIQVSFQSLLAGWKLLVPSGFDNK